MCYLPREGRGAGVDGKYNTGDIKFEVGKTLMLYGKTIEVEGGGMLTRDLLGKDGGATGGH